MHVCVCARAGRAAQRLQEAGAEFGLTASTIHRLLGYKPLNRPDKTQEEVWSAFSHLVGRYTLAGIDLAPLVQNIPHHADNQLNVECIS